MAEVKERVRVKAISRAITSPIATPPARVPRSSARYLRGDKTGILAMRRAVTRDGRIDVWEGAERASALALDFMQNNGWIAGAADQIIVDTIGTELKLNARPDLSKLGYSDKERSDLCQLIEARWKRYAWTPAECDLAGKATVSEMLDGVMRYYLSGGEAFVVLSFLDGRTRDRYGLESSTKFSLIAPHRLPRTTLEFDGLDQGIFHDANGRATHYRFKRREDGIDRDYDVTARDGFGLARVIHAMDRGDNPDSPRGISPLAPILKVIAQSDQLADATLATALLQTVFAATIKSPEPSETAFQAIQTLGDTDPPDNWTGSTAEWSETIGALQSDLIDVWGQRINALKEGGINLAESGRIGHLGPGEELKFHTAETPGSNYLPFSQDHRREMARRLGITFESLTMDHSSASYSSTKMSTATIWPLAIRRRERIAAPCSQGLYEAWLDEEIATGRIPFKGGYRAYQANRAKVSWAEWQGPAKPSADDYKTAMAQKIRLDIGVSSLQDECADDGKDWEELAVKRGNERRFIMAQGLPDPYERVRGGGAGPDGAAAEGRREPAKP